MTGEKFFYSSEDEEFSGYPITWPTAKCVFGLAPQFYSHLVILSDRAIQNAVRLTWVDQSTSLVYSDVDALVHISNTIYRGIVSVSHNFDFLYVMTKDSKCAVSGEFPSLKGTTQESGIHRPVGFMLDGYAKYCIKDDSLIHDVSLNDFSLTGDVNCENVRRDIMSMKHYRNFFKDDFEPILNKIQVNTRSIICEINRLESKRAEINAKWSTCASDKFLRKSMMNTQNQIKSELPIYFNKLSQVKNALGISSMNDKDFKRIAQISTPIDVLSINNLFVYPSYLQALVKVNDEEISIQRLKKYRNDLDVESVPKCDVTIHHRKNNKLRIPEFIEKFNQVCLRFGKIATIKIDKNNNNNNSPYIRFDQHKFDKGIMKVTLLGGGFIIPFVREIKKSIGYEEKVRFKIPQSIIPFCVRFRPCVINTINDWINFHGLQLQQAGPMFIGSQEEVNKAYRLLSSNRTQLIIPYKFVTIPGGIPISHINMMINKENRKLSYDRKWAVDIHTKSIVVPNDIDDTKASVFFKKIKAKIGVEVEKNDDILYNYSRCCGQDDVALSGSQIPLYYRNGSFVCHNFCINCAHDVILQAIGGLFDQEEEQPKMDLLIGNVAKIKPIPPLPAADNESWPSIPFGQFLWSLISEPKLNAAARTWFSAIVYQALHSFFEFCPDHPNILLRLKKQGNLKCVHHECQMYLCKDCKKWHKKNECKFVLQVPMNQTLGLFSFANRRIRPF